MELESRAPNAAGRLIQDAHPCGPGRTLTANTVLGNLKTAIAGTLKSVRPRYAYRYLAEFQYRFNRRFDLAGMLNRLACVAVRTAPRPYKSLKIAHMAG